MHNDRFAPESYEDFLTRGKSSREAARIRQNLADEETRREMELSDAKDEHNNTEE